MVTRGLGAAVAIALAALSAGAAQAACGVSPLPMQGTDVEAFKTNPGGLLSRYMSGGTGMTESSYQLIVTDPTTVDALVGLIPQSNASQKFALGTGIGDAVRQCSATDPAVADAIQTAIAALDQPEFEIAFTQAINQVETAAIPGANGAGGPFGTSAAIEGLLGGDGTPNQSGNYFTGGGAGSPRGDDDDEGSSAVLRAVSP